MAIQSFQLDPSSGGVDAASEVFLDTTGNQAIGTSATHLNLNSSVFSDSNYTLSGNEVTVNSDGEYEVSYGVVYDITNTSGSTRGRCEGWIEDDSGGSYSVSAGSYAGVYHREVAGGSGFSGGTFVNLSDGDKIRLRAQSTYASTNIDTVANKVSLKIKKVG